jgi:cell division protein FtsZ
MTLNLHAPTTEEQLQPRITVVGTGGAGGNAVNNMINSNLEGVEFLVCNTDAQALAGSQCKQRLQLGRNITQGLGAGSRPDVGRAAAEEAIDDIMAHLDGSNMVFITAGMGGGTGTGAAPVIARAAREKGVLTVGVVTKPFHFEGVHRMRLAEQGIQDLQDYVDTLIIIPNQNLFRVANEKTTFADAFKMADDVLYSGVRGVTDLMVMPGLINLDFADIRSVMTEMGKAMMGTGESGDENRAIAAAEAAISNPLLDDVSMKGARGVLINITGGGDMTLFEVDEAANRIRDEVDPDANIIFGSTFDQSMEGTMRVSVVATGIDVEESERPRPVTLSVVSGGHDQGGRNDGPADSGESDGGTQEEAEVATVAATGTDGGYVQGRGPDAYIDDTAEPGREDAFIAPAPAQPPRQPKARQDTRDQGGDGGLKKKGRGLFARMTGAGRKQEEPAARPQQTAAPRRVEEPTLHAGGTAQAERAPEPRAQAARPAEPAARQPQAQPQRRREPTVEARGERTAPAQPQQPAQPQRGKAAQHGDSRQPRLSGLEPADGRERTREEDQLDIPAFLRRQAN